MNNFYVLHSKFYIVDTFIRNNPNFPAGDMINIECMRAFHVMDKVNTACAAFQSLANGNRDDQGRLPAPYYEKAVQMLDFFNHHIDRYIAHETFARTNFFMKMNNFTL